MDSLRLKPTKKLIDEIISAQDDVIALFDIVQKAYFAGKRKGYEAGAIDGWNDALDNIFIPYRRITEQN